MAQWCHFTAGLPDELPMNDICNAPVARPPARYPITFFFFLQGTLSYFPVVPCTVPNLLGMSSPRVLRQLNPERELMYPAHPSAECEPRDENETNALWSQDPQLADDFHPSSRSRPTTTNKVMPTSSQGGVSLSGQARLNPSLAQSVSGDQVSPQSVLTWSYQISKEELMFNQFKKLTVRLLIDVFDLGTDKISENKSTRSTRC